MLEFLPTQSSKLDMFDTAPTTPVSLCIVAAGFPYFSKDETVENVLFKKGGKASYQRRRNTSGDRFAR